MTDSWTPTAENINALPEPVRDYIYHLETMADPAGLVQDNALLKDQTRQLDAMIARLKEVITQEHNDMKKYAVTLIRTITQTAVVNTMAENGIDAVDTAIASRGVKDWQETEVGETFYREVKEVPEVELARAAQTVRTAGPVELNRIEPEEKCKTKVIHGYKVELELFEEDGEPRSDCSVSRTIRGTEFGGSLGMLMGYGSLEDYNTGDEYAVADTHRDAIIKWAEANGY